MPVTASSSKKPARRGRLDPHLDESVLGVTVEHDAVVGADIHHHCPGVRAEARHQMVHQGLVIVHQRPGGGREIDIVGIDGGRRHHVGELGGAAAGAEINPERMAGFVCHPVGGQEGVGPGLVAQIQHLD